MFRTFKFVTGSTDWLVKEFIGREYQYILADNA